MNRLKNVCIMLFCIGTLSSCSLYKPAKLNTPLLLNKGDANLSLSVGRSLDVNASYSPVENIGVIANYSDGYTLTKSTTTTDPNMEETIYEYKNRQAEFGVGYYTIFNEDYYWSIYGGYGFGIGGTDDILENGSIFFDSDGYSAKFEDVFIQSALGFEINADLAFGIAAKTSRIKFYGFESTFTELPDPDFFKDQDKFVTQVALFGKLQPGAVGVEVQAGLAFAEEDKYFTSRVFNFSLGLNLNLDYLRGKRE